jgi:hypothetical protein
MTLGLVGLISAYVLVALLLLSVNLYSAWRWQVKAAVTVVTSAFYIVTYLSLPPLLGWPVTQDLPEKFRLLGVYVQQPDKVADTEGAIYFWVTDAAELGGEPEPRAYRLPYSPALHEAALGAAAKLAKGVAQLGEVKDPEGGVRPLDNPNRQGQVSAPVRFYDVPDPLLPDK